MIPAIERFRKKYVRDKESGCHLWTGSTDKRGYPLFSFGGERPRTARWLYEYYYGQIPAGYDMSHLCDNRLCVRIGPEHIMPETHAENMMRLWRTGANEGCRNGMSKFSEFDVALIRTISENRKAFPPERLAKMFNVCVRTIYNLLAYKTYRDITPDKFSAILAGGEPV